MTQCLLQFCLCLFWNLTRRFTYVSGEALYGEYSYIEEKAVYIVIIHDKTVQWEYRVRLTAFNASDPCVQAAQTNVKTKCRKSQIVELYSIKWLNKLC